MNRRRCIPFSCSHNRVKTSTKKRLWADGWSIYPSNAACRASPRLEARTGCSVLAEPVNFLTAGTSTGRLMFAVLEGLIIISAIFADFDAKSFLGARIEHI